MNRISLIVTAALAAMALTSFADDRKINTNACEDPGTGLMPDPYRRSPHHGWLKGDGLNDLPAWQKMFGRTDLTTLERGLANLYQAIDRAGKALEARDRARTDAEALLPLLDAARASRACDGDTAAMQEYADALNLNGEDWAMIRNGAALPQQALLWKIADLSTRRLEELDRRESALTGSVVGLAQARRAMAEEISRRLSDGFESGAAVGSLEIAGAWNDIVGAARNAEDGILQAATPAAEFRSNGAVGRTDMKRVVERFHASVARRADLAVATLEAHGKSEEAKRVSKAVEGFRPEGGLGAWRTMAGETQAVPGLSELNPALDLLLAYGPEVVAEGAPIARLAPETIADPAGGRNDATPDEKRFAACLMPADVEKEIGRREGRTAEDVASVMQMHRGVELMMRPPSVFK